MPIRDALREAKDARLDLVKVASNAKPPVCKIMDYGKFKYEQSKREKEARKRQRVINVKETRMNPNIDEHDFLVRARRTLEFLENGDKVKASIRFRGREIAHKKLGEEVLKKLADFVKEVAFVEKPPRIEGRNMVMILSPRQNTAKE